MRDNGEIKSTPTRRAERRDCARSPWSAASPSVTSSIAVARCPTIGLDAAAMTVLPGSVSDGQPRRFGGARRLPASPDMAGDHHLWQCSDYGQHEPGQRREGTAQIPRPRPAPCPPLQGSRVPASRRWRGPPAARAPRAAAGHPTDVHAYPHMAARQHTRQAHRHTRRQQHHSSRCLPPPLTSTPSESGDAIWSAVSSTNTRRSH